MEEKYSRDRKNSKLLKINFIGSKQTDETPKIGIFKINLDRSVKKIESISNNQIDTTKIESIVKNSDFGFGPDIDENDVTENMLISYRTNTKLTDWLKTGIIEIDPRWRNWILPLTCVYGKVEKCTPNWPFVFEILPSITSETKLSNSTTDYSLTPKSPISSSINIFPVCSPICNAVVEIYQKTCCCKITLPELDLWLEKLKKWIWTLPPPLPDPPIPGPDPYFMDFVSPPILDPTADKEITRSIKRTISGGLTPTLGNPSQRVIQDVKILLDMPRSERIAYVNERQYLVPIFCTCSSKKIKEVPVNQNGEFSSCFLTNLSKIGCTTTFYYKVKQWQGDKFVYIYDGSTNNEYFESNEEAILKTWKGFSCDSESPVDPGDKFVLLENIGSTRSYKLQSPTQNSEFGVMSANNTDGLVNINFPDQPWAYVLHFRLRFSPGMKALGAILIL